MTEKILNKNKNGMAVLLLVILGYVAGIASKFLNPAYMANFSQKWYVLFFYFLNFVMVGTDFCLYFRNRKLDRLAEEATTK